MRLSQCRASDDFDIYFLESHGEFVAPLGKTEFYIPRRACAPIFIPMASLKRVLDSCLFVSRSFSARNPAILPRSSSYEVRMYIVQVCSIVTAVSITFSTLAFLPSKAANRFKHRISCLRPSCIPFPSSRSLLLSFHVFPFLPRVFDSLSVRCSKEKGSVSGRSWPKRISFAFTMTSFYHSKPMKKMLRRSAVAILEFRRQPLYLQAPLQRLMASPVELAPFGLL